MGDGPRCGINLTFEERWNLLTRQQAKILKEMEAKKRKKVEAEKKAAEAVVQAAADAEFFKKQKLDKDKQCADSQRVGAECASSSSPQGSLPESQQSSFCVETWAHCDQGLLTGSQPLQDPEATPDTLALDYDWSWLGELPAPEIEPEAEDKSHGADSQDAQAGSPLPTVLDESPAEDSAEPYEPNGQGQYCSAVFEDSQF